MALLARGLGALRAQINVARLRPFWVQQVLQLQLAVLTDGTQNSTTEDILSRITTTEGSENENWNDDEYGNGEKLRKILAIKLEEITRVLASETGLPEASRFHEECETILSVNEVAEVLQRVLQSLSVRGSPFLILL